MVDSKEMFSVEMSTAAEALTPLQKRILCSPSVRMSLKLKCQNEISGVAEKETEIVPSIRHISQAILENQVMLMHILTGVQSRIKPYMDAFLFFLLEFHWLFVFCVVRIV